MGRTYVPATAQVSDGIMTLNESTGQSTGGYWLNWNANGFTGHGWFWGKTYSYLPEGWVNAVNSGNTGCSEQHSTTQDDFQKHVSNGHVEDLNLVLGNWPSAMKADFVETYFNNLGGFADGCVELH